MVRDGRKPEMAGEKYGPQSNSHLTQDSLQCLCYAPKKVNFKNLQICPSNEFLKSATAAAAAEWRYTVLSARLLHTLP